MKKLFVIFFIFSSNFIYSQVIEFTNELKKEANIEWDEKLIIVFQELSSCIKCYYEPMDIILNATREIPNKKYKIMALVHCDRKIELGLFKKNMDWKYYLYIDKGDAREKLLATDETIITVLDYQGRNILNIQKGNKYKSAEVLSNVLSK